jgi:serine/threonine-protein kinase
MPLTSGTKLGPYEITGAIGAGGMGEVYRARDTRLDRTVAIKVLPASLANTPEAKQRFEREARAVSALNHPHICTLYDVGSQDGTEFLVMEYLEGETLAARLEKGALPLDLALKTGIEIADALDKAHRQGIIHRDLKPGNIMMTKSGAKLLDFGLAKAIDTTPVSGLTVAETSPMKRSPTTETGTVMGTYQYMAPEIIEGLDADARSDIFSFGAVLYEMATGKRAFDGKTQASVLAAILAMEPQPISALQPSSPTSLDRVVKLCLAKDRDERWQSAHDVKLELQWIAEGGSQAGLPVAGTSPPFKGGKRPAFWIATVAWLIVMALAAWILTRTAKPQQPIQVSADLGADAALTTETLGPNAVLSPDGTKLAFSAVGPDKKRRLYIRSLGQLQATALAGAEGAANPFFSPDSQWIAFFADGKLKKIPTQGGSPAVICDGRGQLGASWGDNGNIVIAGRGGTGLQKVSSYGGTPAALTTLDAQKGETSHRWPQVLPGSRDVIFTVETTNTNTFDDADIVAYSASSGKTKTILHGGFHAEYLSSGDLVYMHNGALYAVPFDAKRMEVTGQAAAVVDNVVANPTSGTAQFSISENGILVYVAGSAVDRSVSIYWMDADGKFAPLRETPANYGNLALSPDGKRLAMDITEPKKSDVWVLDIERDTLTRLTFAGDGDRNSRPVWTPDGQRIVYDSVGKGTAPSIWWIRADGGGNAQQLTQASNTFQIPGSWSPDGRVFAFSQRNPNTGMDIMTVRLDGSEKTAWKVGDPKPFVNTNYSEVDPVFSPDGRWVAYQSNESGASEIYVRPFPGPGGKWQISAGGGSQPQWSRTAKELYYLAPTHDKIIGVTYTVAGDTFNADKPEQWSPGQILDRGEYAPSADGKRIAVLKAPGAVEVPPINKVEFIFNFFDEVRSKVSAGKN